MAKVECIRDQKDIRIYINGLLHMQVMLDSYDGMQAYKTGKRGGRRWFVEVYRKKDKTILLEYEKESLWKEILMEIEDKV